MLLGMRMLIDIVTIVSILLRCLASFVLFLADWHMARDFGMTPPTLNGAFVTCDPTNRIYADQTGTDTMYMMVNHRLVARRLVMRNPTPRVL